MKNGSSSFLYDDVAGGSLREKGWKREEFREARKTA